MFERCTTLMKTMVVCATRVSSAGCQWWVTYGGKWEWEPFLMSDASDMAFCQRLT